ncbi:uncharacterized protein SOCEGT47_077640 [Sorangium cellulosum]|uniref:Putative restriction endonuclease domain-containing protein n=1 Tax=Sorangium cellulosum TaxID=56 RepID=A0A4P2QDF3_SORCE|nr:uncharacterized protein SOCEGT47_077640 [Sorangium cellulosum]
MHQDLLDLLLALGRVPQDPRWHPEGIAPDVYVLPGVERSTRVGVWKVWEMGLVPSFAFEIVSRDIDKDYINSPAKYARLGVEELVVFDPDYQESRSGVRWQILRRTKRGLLRVESTDADRIRSRVLGYHLRVVGEDGKVRCGSLTALTGGRCSRPTPRWSGSAPRRSGRAWPRRSKPSAAPARRSRQSSPGSRAYSPRHQAAPTPQSQALRETPARRGRFRTQLRAVASCASGRARRGRVGKGGRLAARGSVARRTDVAGSRASRRVVHRSKERVERGAEREGGASAWRGHTSPSGRWFGPGCSCGDAASPGVLRRRTMLFQYGGPRLGERSDLARAALRRAAAVRPEPPPSASTRSRARRASRSRRSSRGPARGRASLSRTARWDCSCRSAPARRRSRCTWGAARCARSTPARGDRCARRSTTTRSR